MVTLLSPSPLLLSMLQHLGYCCCCSDVNITTPTTYWGGRSQQLGTTSRPTGGIGSAGEYLVEILFVLFTIYLVLLIVPVGCVRQLGLDTKVRLTIDKGYQSHLNREHCTDNYNHTTPVKSTVSNTDRNYIQQHQMFISKMLRGTV